MSCYTQGGNRDPVTLGNAALPAISRSIQRDDRERCGGWQNAERLDVVFRVENRGRIWDTDAELVAIIREALFKTTMSTGLRMWRLNNRRHTGVRMLLSHANIVQVESGGLGPWDGQGARPHDLGRDGPPHAIRFVDLVLAARLCCENWCVFLIHGRHIQRSSARRAHGA